MCLCLKGCCLEGCWVVCYKENQGGMMEKRRIQATTRRWVAWSYHCWGSESRAGLGLHLPLGFSKFQLSNASPAFDLLACKVRSLVSRSFSGSCSHGKGFPFTGRDVAENPPLSCWLCCCLAPGIPGDCTGASKSSGASSCALLVPSQHQNKPAWRSTALTIDMGTREISLL